MNRFLAFVPWTSQGSNLIICDILNTIAFTRKLL
jgi:hypothetical protein